MIIFWRYWMIMLRGTRVFSTWEYKGSFLIYGVTYVNIRFLTYTNLHYTLHCQPTCNAQYRGGQASRRWFNGCAGDKAAAECWGGAAANSWKEAKTWLSGSYGFKGGLLRLIYQDCHLYTEENSLQQLLTDRVVSPWPGHWWASCCSHITNTSVLIVRCVSPIVSKTLDSQEPLIQSTRQHKYRL